MVAVGGVGGGHYRSGGAYNPYDDHDHSTHGGISATSIYDGPKDIEAFKHFYTTKADHFDKATTLQKLKQQKHRKQVLEEQLNKKKELLQKHIARIKRLENKIHHLEEQQKQHYSPKRQEHIEKYKLNLKHAKANRHNAQNKIKEREHLLERVNFKIDILKIRKKEFELGGPAGASGYKPDGVGHGNGAGHGAGAGNGYNQGYSQGYGNGYNHGYGYGYNHGYGDGFFDGYGLGGYGSYGGYGNCGCQG
ncbi:hypothetical protein A8L45_17490, partial [Veronia pacifica]